MGIYEKLLAIQLELKAPKSQLNSFGGYKYRNCEDILESLKPLLEKAKATVICKDEITNINDRFYVKSTAKLIDIETGESIESTAFAREEQTKKGMDESQITGSCSSYARKYALNGLFCVDDTKDADSQNNTENYETTKKATKKQIEILMKNFKGNLLKKLLESNNVRRIEDFSIEKASEIIGKIMKKGTTND